MPLYTGMGQPYAIEITVPRSEWFDPMTVTGALMKVTKPSGQAVEWVATIKSKTSDAITIAYSLVSGGTDLTDSGLWKVWVQWTVAGMTPGPRTATGTFTVLPASG